MSKKKRQGPITAGELMKQLEADPDYQRRTRERDEALAQRRRFLTKAEAPLVRVLRQAGFQVDSVWDLVNTREPYPEAIPILMELLEGDYPPEYPAAVREGIARALAVPVLDPDDWEILLRCFEREPDEQVKYGLALALQANARVEHYRQLLALVQDPGNGQYRVEFAEALHRFRTEESTSLLKAFSSDPEIGENIKRILKTGTAVIR